MGRLGEGGNSMAPACLSVPSTLGEGRQGVGYHVVAVSFGIPSVGVRGQVAWREVRLAPLRESERERGPQTMGYSSEL